jgi:hypothetical protein
MRFEIRNAAAVEQAYRLFLRQNEKFLDQFAGGNLIFEQSFRVSHKAKILSQQFRANPNRSKFYSPAKRGEIAK